ncbi:type II toxin-antitoxin system PemK/MazF family toxin [Planomonospora corallina]|uniref:Type II toxin-antitoxin system PemK/MazF family toxin n=1 Tax=Planomonospora corallina TaxID=1806052 RepID=A0ABV8IN34_9ACTN
MPLPDRHDARRPLTTRDRGLSHHVLISSSASGLRQRSWARTEDITSISTRRLVGDNPLGGIDEHEIRTVQRWLRRLIAV